MLFCFYANGQVVVNTAKYETDGEYTFTVPANIYEITVECWGAGGGGSCVYNRSRHGGGGGGGAYAMSILKVAPGVQYTIVVGKGGQGLRNNTTAQSSGGPSYVALEGTQLVRAAGGVGGTYDATTRGAGGSTTTTKPAPDSALPENYSIGTTRRAGGAGGTGSSSTGSGGGGGGAGTTAVGGAAGTAPAAGIGGLDFGGNGATGVTGSVAGTNGYAYGGGGSGGRNTSAFLSSEKKGGIGANGAVRISYNTPLNYQLKIFANHAMTILPNTYISIDADITNKGLMYIKSTAAGNGSLIAMRSVAGANNFKIEQYLSKNKWHLASSPITLAKSGNFPGNHMYLRKYIESTNSWGIYIPHHYVSFSPGEGFSVYSKDKDTTVVFSGLINNTDITRTLTNTTGNNMASGWNLIGNPFTSAIDLNSQFGWSKANVGNAIYTFDGVQEKYIYFLANLGNDDPQYTNPPIGTGVAADQYIAMGQGFFVHAVNNNASITIKKNAQKHNAIKFKNEEYIPNLIRVKVDGNSRSDESILYIAQNSLETYDYQRDAMKLFDSYPQLYSQKQDTKLAISAYDDIDQINGKLLYLEVGETENYTISFTHSIENMDLYLKDLFTNTYISANETYKFTAKPEDRNMRFEFVVMQPSGIENEDFISTEDMHIWEYDNTLYVNTRINEEVKSINIYNSIGELVLSSTSNQTNLNALPFGVYIVKVSTSMENKTTKVLIK